MAASDIVARVVALIGGAAILMRRQAPGSETPAVGDAPAIPEARPQAIPTLKMPTARGWSGDRTPVAAHPCGCARIFPCSAALVRRLRCGLHMGLDV